MRRREPTRGNQIISLVTEAEALAIRAQSLGSRRLNEQGTPDAILYAVDDGMFYLIQLEPEHDPGRFKVGFTTDLDGRLRHHRCSAPFAVYKKSWPCRRTWERTVIDCITAGLEQLHTEVFRCTSLEEVTDRGDRFFSMMPSVNVAPEPDDEEAPAQEPVA